MKPKSLIETFNGLNQDDAWERAFVLRLATPKDAKLVFGWDTDYMDAYPLGLPEFEREFADALSRQDEHLILIAEDYATGIPVAYTRVDRQAANGPLDLSYIVAPEARHQKLGVRVNDLVVNGMLPEFDLQASIKIGNIASQAVVRRLGFVQEAETDVPGHISFARPAAYGS